MGNLILKRSRGQAVIIETDRGPVTITVFCDGQVKLGIDAPHEYRIVRSELLTRSMKPEKERSTDVLGNRP